MSEYVKKPTFSKVCANCGELFETNKFRQRFCKVECRVEFKSSVMDLGVCPHCGRPLL